MAVIDQRITSKYAAYNGDCIEVMHDMPDASIHLSVYSPPFGGLYHYSSDERDLSNASTYDEFMQHYAFVIRELARITKPGRLTAVHATDVPASNTGMDHLIDFPGHVISEHEKHGWKYVARHAIWKEPLWVRNRTLAKSLAHRTIVDDSAYAGVASADYLLVFRNKGDNQEPIAHPTGFTEYAGESPVPAEVAEYKGWTGDQKQNRWSHWIWRQYASSVWDDIRMGRVLPYHDCKDPDDEKHVHPLQLDIIDRVVQMRSNPGDVVFTPFMGVGSEVYSAVRAGRLGVGAELKSAYYRQALANLEAAADEASEYEQPELFIDTDGELG